MSLSRYKTLRGTKDEFIRLFSLSIGGQKTLFWITQPRPEFFPLIFSLHFFPSAILILPPFGLHPNSWIFISEYLLIGLTWGANLGMGGWIVLQISQSWVIDPGLIGLIRPSGSFRIRPTIRTWERRHLRETSSEWSAESHGKMSSPYKLRSIGVNDLFLTIRRNQLAKNIIITQLIAYFQTNYRNLFRQTCSAIAVVLKGSSCGLTTRHFFWKTGVVSW